MPKRIKISVTQEDIDTGIRADCNSCPIALAIKRAANANIYISVGSYYFNIWSETLDKYLVFNRALPESAQKFIYNFDSHIPVEPFKFFVEDF